MKIDEKPNDQYLVQITDVKMEEQPDNIVVKEDNPPSKKDFDSFYEPSEEEVDKKSQPAQSEEEKSEENKDTININLNDLSQNPI